MPTGKKPTPEQIVAILRRVEQEEAEAICRNVNISDALPPEAAVWRDGIERGEGAQGAARRERQPQTAGHRSGPDIQVIKGVNKMVSPSQRHHGERF